LTGFVVIDTNVLVSGMVRGGGTSAPRRIVEAMIGGHLRFLLSDALLREYRQVLLRPSIAQRHRLTEVEVDHVLLEIVVNATMRGPKTLGVSDGSVGAGEDAVPADDAHVAALVRSMPGTALVTGDKRLADAVRPWCEALAPAAFAAVDGYDSRGT
jgi:predicted nucleic acid-binding protein